MYSQVQVSVYCVRWIPAHIRCTECSILLRLIDICFLPCICLRLWQISKIQTCLCVVVGPVFVSTSPAFMRCSASGSAWPACPKKGKLGPHFWGLEVSTLFARQFITHVTAPPLVGCVVWSQIITFCHVTSI